MGVKMKQLQIKNQKGLATIESVVLLVVFLVLSTYSIGFFGVIHTSIKNSIGARSLAFETFRNRANLTYWRDNRPEARKFTRGYRNHGIISEAAEGETGSTSPYFATARQIAFVRNPDFQRSNITNEGLPRGLETQQANSVFIKTKYGICLNAGCGE